MGEDLNSLKGFVQSVAFYLKNLETSGFMAPSSWPTGKVGPN